MYYMYSVPLTSSSIVSVTPNVKTTSAVVSEISNVPVQTLNDPNKGIKQEVSDDCVDVNQYPFHYVTADNQTSLNICIADAKSLLGDTLPSLVSDFVVGDFANVVDTDKKNW